jgi:hypothetical protein
MLILVCSYFLFRKGNTNFLAAVLDHLRQLVLLLQDQLIETQGICFEETIMR